MYAGHRVNSQAADSLHKAVCSDDVLGFRNQGWHEGWGRAREASPEVCLLGAYTGREVLSLHYHKGPASGAGMCVPTCVSAISL